MSESVAGRAYPRVYRTSGRGDVAAFVADAVTAGGGRLVWHSEPTRAPLYVAADAGDGERLGLLVYPFRMTTVLTRNRPSDESRMQVRYGGEASWDGDHSLGWDPAGVDVTMVVGCHLQRRLFVGLDPATYDPLPMGISLEFKEDQLTRAAEQGWHVFTRVNRSGVRRGTPRAELGEETVVAFAPDRFLDYARLDRRAADLGLDPPLRYSAARALAAPAGADSGTLHRLEQQFGLSSSEILDIIAGRNRLAVAVRGGVAEHHLERVLRNDPDVVAVRRLDVDSMHDFDVTLRDGRTLRVECKNAAPERYADGSEKVEVQKTRASKDDPASRFYRADQFDVVAACLFATRGEWTFRFQATRSMQRHPQFPDRLGVNHRVDDTWADTIAEIP